MKKSIALFMTLFINQLITTACPVCERSQPKITKGIVHGAGPINNGDYVIVSIIATITLITLFYTIKWLIKPGEKNKNHIKYSILNK